VSERDRQTDTERQRETESQTDRQTDTYIHTHTHTHLALRSRAGEIKAAGDLTVSLLWQSIADLDLHVIDPRGEEIFFENPRSLTGGLLEYEANGSCLMATAEPLESIFWKAGTAPPGEYQVIVDYYGTCGDETEQVFVIGVWIGGEMIKLIEGTIAPQTLQVVHKFGY